MDTVSLHCKDHRQQGFLLRSLLTHSSMAVSPGGCSLPPSPGSFQLRWQFNHEAGAELAGVDAPRPKARPPLPAALYTPSPTPTPSSHVGVAGQGTGARGATESCEAGEGVSLKVNAQTPSPWAGRSGGLPQDILFKKMIKKKIVAQVRKREWIWRQFCVRLS